MTWLGDPAKKMSPARRAQFEASRALLVREIEDLGKKDVKTFRFPHQLRQHQEDLTRLAREVAKIDTKLGRAVDWNSGTRT